MRDADPAIAHARASEIVQLKAAHITEMNHLEHDDGISLWLQVHHN